ncbi:hypothetical protein [Amycolatopsis aidingensis]|uniref:hypothetical protein n=1 Tax=Amycolatopsis aidingensis TaxID=2842453 RepID=UPI001C0D0657|nr:hypothetical protein [Amycolatopsis aidingensis]
MTVRDWVISEFRKDGRVIEPVGEHGVVASRTGRPDAVAYCCETTTITTVTAQVVSQALYEVPDTKMIIVFLSRQLVDPDAYDHARERGVCLDTFGGFITAVDDYDDISRYRHREEKYLRRRLAATRAVTTVLRKGHRAWRLERVDGLRPLTIITDDKYETTDHEVTTALNRYPKLTPDAFVNTNPSTRGFSGRVVATTRNAGIRLLTLPDFLDAIRHPWT